MTQITSDEWLAELERYSGDKPSEFLTIKQIARVICKIPDSIHEDDIPLREIIRTRAFVRKLIREGRAIEGKAYSRRLGDTIQRVPGVKLVDAVKGKRGK